MPERSCKKSFKVIWKGREVFTKLSSFSFVISLGGKMSCKMKHLLKLRKIHKHIDGRLSEREVRLAEEHIRNCPDCAAEVESLEKMRSLLQAAGRIEVPDMYWDTYWERLGKKLPDKPSPVTLASRISVAAADLLRRPAVLGRIAIYILILAFLIYTTPERSLKVQMPSEAGEAKVSAAPLKPQEVKKSAEAIKETTPGHRRVGSGAMAGSELAKRKAKASDKPVEQAADKHNLDFAFRPPETQGATAKSEDKAAAAEPAKSPTVAETRSRLERDRQGIESELYSVDEYVAADNYFKNGEYLRAIPAYQNFIKANLDDYRALKAKYQIGEAYYQIGNYSEALSNFVALTDAEESKVTAAAKASEKRDESKGLPVSELKEELKEVRERDAKAERLETVRGMAGLGSVAQQKEALPETREGLMSRAIFRQAESYEHLGRHAEALAVYKKYMGKYPQGEYLSKAKEKIFQLER